MKHRHHLIFEALLRTFPPAFRKRFAEGMRDSFESGYQECEARGPGWASLFTWRTAVDLAVAGLRERLHSSLRPSASGRPRRTTWSEMLAAPGHELRLAFRSVRRHPGFAAVPVAALALGIGANTAIFSVINGVLLSPLPYAQPEELVTVSVEMADGNPGYMSYPDLVDLASESGALASLVGYRTTTMALGGVGEPRAIEVARVTKGLMGTFRETPALGRDLQADEFGPDASRTVVLSHSFWQTHFGGAERALGESVSLNGESYEVVGIAAPSFAFPPSAQLWIPRSLDSECGRRCYTMETVGRLSADADVTQLADEIRRVARNLERAYPESNAGRTFLVRTLEDQVVGTVRGGLWLILGAVGVVLLIACANVANILLVRASARQMEVALRGALGASRRRLFLQLFMESCVIAVLGGLAGLGLAHFGVQILPHISGGGIPRIEEVTIDRAVLLFTGGAVLLVTILFGAAPAAATAGGTSSGALKGRADRPDRRGGRSRSFLVGAEMAMSAMLLVAAGLLMRSFTQLYAVDVGFETQQISQFDLELPQSRYASLAEVRTFYRRLEERLRSVPGVEAVGSVFGPPLGEGGASARILRDGRPDPTPTDETRALVHAVGPGWMETMRIPVVRGRGLTERDDGSADPVAVVSEMFVRENFPDEDPLGKTFRVPLDVGFGSPTWRIVGVAGDIRSRGLRRATAAAIYVPHGQYGPRGLTVTVRGTPASASALPAIAEQVRFLDAGLPMYRVQTMEQVLEREVAPTRFYLVLVGLFAGLAATLAAIGLYGVVAFVASCRTHEIGLRVALGAGRTGIIRMVVGQGLRPAVTGLAIGLVGALFVGHRFEGVLFGVQPRDPLIFGGTAALLMLVALTASVLPALRAAHVDPVRALRSD